MDVSSILSALPIELDASERAELATSIANYEPEHGVREMAFAEFPHTLESLATPEAAATWTAYRDSLTSCGPFGFRSLREGAALIVCAARLAFPDLPYRDAARAWADASVDVMIERSIVLKPLVIACDGRFEQFVKVNHDASQHWLNFGETHIAELTDRSACVAHKGEYASFAYLSHVGFHAGMMRVFGQRGEVELEVHDERDFDLVMRW